MINTHTHKIHAMNSDLKESAWNAGDPGLIPGLGRSPGEGNGNPLQYSCLENSMDRGAQWAIVHGVTESDMTIWLTHTHTHTHTEVFLLSCVPLHCGLLMRMMPYGGSMALMASAVFLVASPFNCRASEPIWDGRDHRSLGLFCEISHLHQSALHHNHRKKWLLIVLNDWQRSSYSSWYYLSKILHDCTGSSFYPYAFL